MWRSLGNRVLRKMFTSKIKNQVHLFLENVVNNLAYNLMHDFEKWPHVLQQFCSVSLQNCFNMCDHSVSLCIKALTQKKILSED